MVVMEDLKVASMSRRPKAKVDDRGLLFRLSVFAQAEKKQ
ncbi:hypothetical protein SAMN05421693_1357 [Ectothiorhodospira magna]|uniref:Transposase n=1 Tax=Ectothiorhodospira magna TaxID=867345 RepID=A0A1H9GD71_9GAMM|nr:hypothetical protein SAMN05421693_1357 [Ectothiorhodospira magna]